MNVSFLWARSVYDKMCISDTQLYYDITPKQMLSYQNQNMLDSGLEW